MSGSLSDAVREVSARCEAELGYALVKVALPLMAELAEQGSPPVTVRLSEPADDGTRDLICTRTEPESVPFGGHFGGFTYGEPA